MKSLALIFGGFGFQEVVVILLIVLLLFGGRKIPELMKGIGKGIRSFKEGVNGIEKDINNDPKDESKSSSKNDSSK